MPMTCNGRNAVVLGLGLTGITHARHLAARGARVKVADTRPAPPFADRLRAALGTIAVIVRQEIVLFIMGGVFVAETLSVMIQVISFKTRGKRVFRMAPIHHHYELKGWEEPKIIVRFWLISILLGLLAVGTLKLR